MITSFSPNSTWKDVLITLKYLLLPWNWFSWKNGKKTREYERKLEDFLGIKDQIITFDSGRTALFKGLKALNVGARDEVIVQAFTCVVVTNAIKYSGAKPIFVDIGKNTYNMDPQKLEKLINKNTKAIIVQHTFGLAAKLNEILKIAKKHKIKVIEDCAHSLGGEYEGKKLGTFGDAAIFSFGIDKVISSVRGGALLLKNNNLYKKVRKEDLPHLPTIIILRHLLHPMIFSIGRALYGLYIGKILLYLSKKLKITALIIEKEEKKCKRVSWFPAKFPNCMAEIAMNQLKLLPEANKHREAIATFYRNNISPKYKHPQTKNNIFLRYPLQSENVKKLKAKAKNAGVFLGDWYDTIVAPKDIDFNATGYKKGSCKVAESVSKKVFNLPTHRRINLAKAQKIVDLFE